MCQLFVRRDENVPRSESGNIAVSLWLLLPELLLPLQYPPADGGRSVLLELLVQSTLSMVRIPLRSIHILYLGYTADPGVSRGHRHPWSCRARRPGGGFAGAETTTRGGA